MCSSLRWLHISHLTSQHQTKRHLHFSSTYRIRVWWPRPQHIILQPSIPGDVRLHNRPFVPKMPNLCEQNNKNMIDSFGDALFKANENWKLWLTHRHDRNSRANLPSRPNRIWLAFYTVDHVDAILIRDRHVRSAEIERKSINISIDQCFAENMSDKLPSHEMHRHTIDPELRQRHAKPANVSSTHESNMNQTHHDTCKRVAFVILTPTF